MLEYVVLCFATFRVANALVHESGPRQVFTSLRRWVQMFTCFYCLSFWVAAVVHWLATWTVQPLMWFAISGGAILAHDAARYFSAYAKAVE